MVTHGPRLVDSPDIVVMIVITLYHLGSCICLSNLGPIKVAFCGRIQQNMEKNAKSYSETKQELSVGVLIVCLL